MAEDDETNIVNIDFYKQSELSRYIIIIFFFGTWDGRHLYNRYFRFHKCTLGALEVWPALKIWN